MLFNSYSFIFLFLPVTFIGMFWLGRYSHRLAALWLGLASLTFYAVWDARFVLLLLASIAFNYGAGYWIGLRRSDVGKQALHGLVAAIMANLLLLGYFKYANFFIASANEFFGSRFSALDVILPLGISFFTFTQIAFLVDAYRGITREYGFIHYLLFVSYFPHLIAGPVLHHRQIMPQFANPATYRINPEHVAVGLTIFVLGLAKKVLIADSLAQYATPIFDAVRDGQTLMFAEAWIGTLAYGLQLYFDFSAYSDMAIGLSLMLNVRLPLNFDSPLKATSMIEFWQRWHMTLSAFFRDYIYYPLGGRSRNPLRRNLSLMATMLLCGLWHGAGWTFIACLGLFGVYVLINRGWRNFKARLGWGNGGRFARLSAGTLTFLAVIEAFMIFRADSLTSAWSMFCAMAGVNGVSLPTSLESQLSPLFAQLQLDVKFTGFLPATGTGTGWAVSTVAISLLLVWLFPNVRQLLVNYRPTWEDVAGVRTPAPVPRSGLAGLLAWRPNGVFAGALGILFTVCIFRLTHVTEFLYFQF